MAIKSRPFPAASRAGRARPPLRGPGVGVRAQTWFRQHVTTERSVLPDIAPQTQLQTYFVIAALLLFAGIYTDIGILVGENNATIPMVSALPGLAMLAIYPGVLTWRLFRLILVPTVVVFSLGVLAPSFTHFVLNRLLATGQTAFSMTIGLVAYMVLARCGRMRVHRFISYALPIFLFLILCEIAIPPFRDLVTAFLAVFPRGFDLDAIAEREATFGGYRPKLFTSETSYLAMGMFMLLVGYLWTGTRPRRYIWAAVYGLVAFALVRSPILILPFGVLFVNIFSDKTLGRRRFQYAIWTTFGVAVLALLVGIFGYQIIANRVSGILNGNDYSTTYRTYGSIAVAFGTIRQYPLFGVGPGSLVPIKNLIFDTYLRFGVPLSAVTTDWNLSIDNAIASFLVYFGLIGTAIGGLLFWRLFSSDVRAPRAPLAVALLAYSATCGAVYTPKFIIAVLVLIAVAKLRPKFGESAPAPAPLRPSPRGGRPLPPGRPPVHRPVQSCHALEACGTMHFVTRLGPIK